LSPDAADRELGIDRSGEAGGELDALAPHRVEALEREGHQNGPCTRKNRATKTENSKNRSWVFVLSWPVFFVFSWPCRIT
jgi:hypothetical protein